MQKLCAIALLASSVFGYAQTTTTCTPTFGGGSRCTTTEDPLAKLQREQQERQRQWQDESQRQADALRNSQQQQQANRPQCTTYARNPYTGQLEARTAPCF